MYLFVRFPIIYNISVLFSCLHRMALETSTSAADAVDKICDFIEKNHKCDKSDMPKYGFLICDNSEAWILNVAGKFWAAEVISGKVI